MLEVEKNETRKRCKSRKGVHRKNDQHSRTSERERRDCGKGDSYRQKERPGNPDGVHEKRLSGTDRVLDDIRRK